MTLTGVNFHYNHYRRQILEMFSMAKVKTILLNLFGHNYSLLLCVNCITDRSTSDFLLFYHVNTVTLTSADQVL